MNSQMHAAAENQAEQEQEISFSQTIQVFGRLMAYLSFFKARIAAKLGLMTFEHTFRILLLPWPLLRWSIAASVPSPSRSLPDACVSGDPHSLQEICGDQPAERRHHATPLTCRTIAWRDQNFEMRW